METRKGTYSVPRSVLIMVAACGVLCISLTLRSVRKAIARGCVGMEKLLGPEAAYGAARRYSERGKYRDALSGLAQAHEQWQISRGVDDAWTVTALVHGAYCKLRLGDLSAGAEDLKVALTLRATNPDAKDMPREADIKIQLAWANEQLGE